MKIITLILLFPVILSLQTIKFIPLKYDSPLTQQGSFFKYDKADHFAAHSILTLIIPSKKYNIDIWGSVFAGLMFELNDGSRASFNRTLGFSLTDLIFDAAGAIFGGFLKDLLHNWGVYILINSKGIKICL